MKPENQIQAARVKSLIGCPWVSVDAQAGKIQHRSSRFPGAWSATGFLVRSPTDMLICCESEQRDDEEQFTLRFIDESSAVLSLLKGARPPYSPIGSWPNDLHVPMGSSLEGPDFIEIGFGRASETLVDRSSGAESSVLWCLLGFDSTGVLIYVDPEIPLNVGIASQQSTIASIKAGLNADAIAKLTCQPRYDR
jgi:hypothetical protein